jgi:hypothetical protein
MLKKVEKYLKKNKFTYYIFKPFVHYFRDCFFFISRNRNLLNINNFSNKYKNIFILDTRVHSIIFDSVVLLIRGSNFFYNDKWSLIIYEDDLHRYNKEALTKEIYLNSLVNIFLQSLLILPNPPINIKIVNNSYELLKIIKQSNKMFPENYNYLNKNKQYLLNDYNEKDFQNFKINRPILKANRYYSEIFKKYLTYRNIKKYITITIRTKSWSNTEWNTNLEDMKLFINFIKKNNLKKYDLLILPDTEEDIPKKLLNFIKKNNLKYHIFNQGAFSIPLRLLSYSKSLLNMGSTNGPVAMWMFIKNNAYLIMKDPNNYFELKKFIKKFNKEIFPSKKFFTYKKF